MYSSFHSNSCDIISTSFAYQDDSLHITSFSTLNRNILGTRSDTETPSMPMALFPILSEDQHVLGVNILFTCFVVITSPLFCSVDKICSHGTSEVCLCI